MTIETKYLEYVDHRGGLYDITVEVETHMLSKGNYSSAAECPDEYYSTYKDEFSFVEAYYTPKDSEDSTEVCWDDLPADVQDDIEAGFEEEYWG